MGLGLNLGGGLSGAATGASIGSVIPGIGTVAGAIGGGILGLFSGGGGSRKDQEKLMDRAWGYEKEGMALQYKVLAYHQSPSPRTYLQTLQKGKSWQLHPDYQLYPKNL